MSNLYINIRFGTRYLQLDRDWRMSFRANPYWEFNKPDTWFEIYTLFGLHL